MADTGSQKRHAAETDKSKSKRHRSGDNPFSMESMRRVYHETTPWRGNVQAKWASAAPFHFFLTRVKAIPETYDEDLSITFQELLDTSLGEIEHSLHVNYMVELPWLLAQYAIVGIFNPPMTIVYGVEDEDLVRPPPHLKLTAVKVQMSSVFGHHHTKMSVFFYKDKSVRIVVSTANLVESDWENRTQGIWISPRCPALAESKGNNCGESDTFFKCDIIHYLNGYHIVEMRPWLQRLQRVDMSDINVFLVSSVPGVHSNDRYGIKRISRLLKEHVPQKSDMADWEIVAQCSSIGSLGGTPVSWLFAEFGRSLQEEATSEPSPVTVIYPAVSNVRSSVDGMLGGACLPYSTPTHLKQLWLHGTFKQWKSDCRFRTRAVPHIKTYTKLSPDGSHIAWFLLTSANLSKAAWGNTGSRNGTRITSYEAGVLFLPKFTIGKSSFKVKKKGEFKENEHFPLPYDSPLTSYAVTDKVFLYDKCFSR